VVAAAAALHLAEGLEHLLPHGFGNARAVVLHLDPGLPAGRRQAQLDGAAVAGELEGVGKKVEQDALVLFRIHLGRQARRRGHGVADAAAFGQGIEVGGDDPGQVRQVALRVVHDHAPGFQLGHVQQVADVPVEHAGVAFHHLQVPPQGGRQVRVGQVLADGAQDQGQGGAQFMADVGEELGLQFIQFPGLLVEPGQLGVGLVQAQVVFGDGLGAGVDVRLHLFRLLPEGVGDAALLQLLFPQHDELGDVLGLVDDVAQPSLGIQHRGVDGRPVTHLEAAALFRRAPDIVFLHRHQIGLPGLQHPFQGGPQVVHAVGGGIVRVVREDVEHVPPQHVLPPGQGGLGIGTADGDDPQFRVQGQAGGGDAFEEGLEIRGGKGVLPGRPGCGAACLGWTAHAATSRGPVCGAGGAAARYSSGSDPPVRMACIAPELMGLTFSFSRGRIKG